MGASGAVRAVGYQLFAWHETNTGRANECCRWERKYISRLVVRVNYNAVYERCFCFHQVAFVFL